ncbi:NACHT domain-containing protein [Microbacterium oxydans]|uniref:NACHT domain-containing protein n=1 Tax=Microbacterium oxydans TaxID=82380 RepID=UPI00142D5BDE|nr:NACHT domain-containing protein [Microbacterium oxydans]
MDAELLALFVQMVESGVNLSFEAVRRKKTKDNLRLSEAFRSLDPQALWDSISPVSLATFMRGGVSANAVKKMMEQTEFNALSRELFLACVADPAGSTTTETARASLQLYSEIGLQPEASREDARAFGEALSTRLVELSQVASRTLHEADPSLAQQLQQTALLKRLVSMLDVVSAHHDALVRLADPDTREPRRVFVEAYRRACIERHGYITPPDFETNRKLPIEQLYVAPNIRERGAPDREQGKSVAEFALTIDRSVVLGDPGGGKSTLSAFIASTFAKQDGPVPFHVTLRNFAAFSEDISLLDFIERELKPRYQVAPVPGLVEDLLVTGKAIVIFDGLDELIDASKRREVTKSVELFGVRYPNTPILITSRRVGYDQARLDPAIFDAYLIDGFEDSEVERYVNNWFQLQDEYDEQEAAEQAEAFVQQSAAVPDLRTNPLMLALMCIIFRGENYIPRNRPAVYEKCATLLFEKWDGHRGIEVPLQARDHVDSAMKYIAYRFITSGSGDSGIEEKLVVSMLAEYLHPRAVDSAESAARAAKEFVDYCAGRAWVFTDAGLTSDDEPIFTFTHRTFMEYFAAVHLTRITDTPEALANLLLPYVAREEWDVVAQLALQQVDGKTDQGTARALGAMLGERRKRSTSNRGNVLAFIARCLSFAVIPPALVRKIASACVQHALNQSPSLRMMGEGGKPLHILRGSTLGLEAEYAADQVKTDLGAALGSEPHRRAALYIALYWLARDQLNEMMGVSPEVEWLSADVSFAEENRELLASVADPVFMIPQLFAWHGIAPVEEARVSVSESSSDFCSRYFDEQKLTSGLYVGPSLSELFFYGTNLHWEVYSSRQQDWFAAFCGGFVEDFASMNRRLPDSPARRRLSARRVFMFYGATVPSNQSVTDAVLITHLASIELFVSAAPNRRNQSSHRELFTRHWQRDDDGEPLAALRAGASAPIAEFARQWFDREKTVFENSLINDPGRTIRPTVARSGAATVA